MNTAVPCSIQEWTISKLLEFLSIEEMMKVKLVIGDWSDDGHGKCDFVHFEVNKTQEEIIGAYKKFVKKYKIGFDRSKDVTIILADYEDNVLSVDIVKTMQEAGVRFDKLDHEIEDGEYWACPTDAAILFMEMARTQLDGFEYKIIDDDIPCLNGFWSKNFNVSIGYGCYH